MVYGNSKANVNNSLNIGQWVTLPEGLPWIPESKVTLDGASEVRGAQGFDLCKFLALIPAFDQSHRNQLSESLYIRLPLILKFKINILAL